MPETVSIQKEKRALWLLYILACYILFQLSWWGYHLIQLNRELLEMKSIMLGISLHDLLTAKIWMVIGEGSVFLVLLLLGFWYIKRTVSRELRLARMEKTFLLSVTHELKTPVAAVKLFLETMQSRKLSEEQTSKVLNDALRETKRLQALTENILLATRLDQRSDSMHRESLDLAALCKAEIQRFKALNAAEIVFACELPVFLHGDRQMILALIDNLIDNAIKYSPANSPVTVSLEYQNGSAVLRVADKGRGIPDADKSRVFDKFFRGGNEETRTTQGTGLGLFICKSIVKMHGGEISVTDNKPNGSIFVVKLPSKNHPDGI